MPSQDITYCTCYECDIECERHPKHIPKGQKEAVFADFCGICKPYLRSVLKEIIKNEEQTKQ